MLQLEKLSFGVGDRFARQAVPQLRAFQLLAKEGVSVTPVWNKSNREHSFVGSQPASVRTAAQQAITALGWSRPWHVDADHIRLDTVERYLDSADFFTLDVADAIGQPAAASDVAAFVRRHPELVGQVEIAGLPQPFDLSQGEVERIAGKYLLAVQTAGRIYRRIAAAKGEDGFIAEISVDETDTPQTPPELLVILAAVAEEKIRLQTIAPKFTGRFNKGVDYVGDVAQFAREFSADLAVIAHASKQYGLPANLKLSVHSGSDKFQLYPVIRQALVATGAGVHVKTAGTTWLEELIGLAAAGGDALDFTKELYAEALAHQRELCAPYASVIDIDPALLPSVITVEKWSSEEFTGALRHIPGHPLFNPHVRQLLHVAFKLAAQAGNRYYDLLSANAEIVGKNVTENLYQRHLRPLFGQAQ
ncbi:MAG: tagaturonate epimerase family protein [Pirellulales bacterium]|nr:tagaturonate epimerase family protein [Pirellulales bacterium]